MPRWITLGFAGLMLLGGMALGELAGRVVQPSPLQAAPQGRGGPGGGLRGGPGGAPANVPKPIETVNQPLFSPEPDDRQKTGAVLGLVVRGGSEQPLTRAKVELVPAARAGLDVLDTVDDEEETNPSRNIISADINGRFSFSGIPPGRYTLIATREGFLRQGYGQSGVNRYGVTFPVEAGKTLDNIVLRMTPAPAVSGIVRAPDNTPLAAATAYAYHVRWTPFGRQLKLVQTAMTNDRGEYRLFWLDPGEYYIAASYTGRVRPPGEIPLTPNLAGPDEGYLSLYFPGEPSPEQAKTVRVGATDVAGVNIALKALRKTRIQGQLTWLAAPLTRLRVTLLLRDGSPVPGLSVVSARSDGRFEVRNVLPGNYILLADGEDPAFYPAKRYFSDVTPIVVTDSGLDNLTVPLAIGMLVGLSVTNDRPSDRLPGVVQFCRVGSFEKEEKHCFGDLSVKLNGSSRSFFLPIDNMEIHASLPDGVYVQAITPARYEKAELNRRLRAVEEMMPQPKPPPCPPLICLKIQSGVNLAVTHTGNREPVEGTVRASRGDPAPAAQVVLIPVPEDSRNEMGPGGQRQPLFRAPGTELGAAYRYRMGGADAEGKFQIEGVYPGRYVAIAFEELEYGAYYAPDFLSRWAARGVPVTVNEPQRREDIPVLHGFTSDLVIVTVEEMNR